MCEGGWVLAYEMELWRGGLGLGWEGRGVGGVSEMGRGSACAGGDGRGV